MRTLPVINPALVVDPSLIQDAGPGTGPGPSTHAIGSAASTVALGGGVSAQAVGGFFTPPFGVLTVLGDNLDNNVSVGRNAAGTILVNGGAVPVAGGTPTVANTQVIAAFGLGGNDVITLDETHGALPRANLFGGTGNDVLTAGSGADSLFGQAGNDTLLGKGGADQLFGGAGDDVLTGGDANDAMFGEAGNDRLIWNPGDDDDLMEGGAGIDTAETNGGNGAEQFTLASNGARVRLDRVDPAPFRLDIGTTEKHIVNARGGDDTVDARGLLAASGQLTIDGGAGNDRINGGQGNDLLLGGDGNDFIDGDRGNDVGVLGAGDDVFQWDPGEGNDVIEGQGGFDTMLFNGSGANERVDISANGGRVRFFRDVANVVMDLNDVEVADFNALGGADDIVVGDPSGTDLQQVSIDLAGTLNGSTGDGQADRVTAHVTQGDDFVDVLASGTTISIVGTPAFVQITNAEAQDRLVINGLGGDDQLGASSLAATSAKLTLDGGAGDDVLFGGQGADTLIGGTGDDFIDGNRGDDLALMGAGDDIFIWAPGEGNDTLEGEDGNDSMTFLGSNANENIDIAANGERVRFFRDVAAVTMDLNDVEGTTFNAFGGADNIVIGDLSGTDLTRLEISLIGGSGQANDGQADSISAAGSAGADVIALATANKQTVIAGLAAEVRVTGADAGLDSLRIDGGAGADIIDATDLQAGLFRYTALGGLGNDVFLGSAGDDLLIGGDGDDVALMGAGDDTFAWNPGEDNDTLEGEDGFDTMLFNGAGANENIDISADGGRVRFLRDVANVVMDNNDVERIQFNALGGADNIVIEDLSGTDQTVIDIDLAGTLGGTAGDGRADTVTARATNGDDVVQAGGSGTEVSLLGLAARINVAHFEAANDRLVVDLQAGDDVFDGSGLPAGSLPLTVDGGVGDDVLIGGAGDDVLLGGDGDDVLLGGVGDDVLIGGAGDDVLIGGGDDDIVIQGFTAGAGTEDRIDLTSFGDDEFDFAWVIEHARTVGKDTLLDLGEQQILLEGVAMASLDTDDFLL